MLTVNKIDLNTCNQFQLKKKVLKFRSDFKSRAPDKYNISRKSKIILIIINELKKKEKCLFSVSLKILIFIIEAKSRLKRMNLLQKLRSRTSQLAIDRRNRQPKTLR